MPYSTIDDQKNEIQRETLRQAVDYENKGSLTDAEVLARFNQIRDEADGEIDAMLSIGGYVTPVTAPAAALVLLRSWSKAIAAYKVFKLTEIMPDIRVKEYSRVSGLLERTSQGSFRLPDKAPESGSGEFSCGALITSHFSSSDS